MWDPEKYLDFAESRARPFHDLTARIGAEAPRRVVDLGCGPGNMTVELRKRWPTATLECGDSSPEMVESARSLGLDAQLLDVRDWTPSPDTDVVVSNAVLQWLPDHRDLLRRWASSLPAGAWIAASVPGNGAAPSYTCVRDVATSPTWSSRLGDVILREDEAVDDPRGYAQLLADTGCAVDAWETTYLQPLTGPQAVLEWISGSALRPLRAALGDEDWARFRDELAPLLGEAYPATPEGVTWFSSRRVFIVARVTG